MDERVTEDTRMKGYLAGMRNKPLDVNPYTDDEALSEIWLDGYGLGQEARKEFE